MKANVGQDDYDTGKGRAIWCCLLLTCPSPPPLTILLESLVPAMAVTPILCALLMLIMRRPLSGAKTRIMPSFQAGRNKMDRSVININDSAVKQIQ